MEKAERENRLAELSKKEAILVAQAGDAQTALAALNGESWAAGLDQETLSMLVQERQLDLDYRWSLLRLYQSAVRKVKNDIHVLERKHVAEVMAQAVKDGLLPSKDTYFVDAAKNHVHMTTHMSIMKDAESMLYASFQKLVEEGKVKL